jgi:glycosyltransferase involved in cell wall biosynthesis
VVGLDNGHWTMMTYGASVLALLFGAMLVLVLVAPGEGRASRVLRSPTLRFFGKYSYGLYVFHYLLSPLFRQYVSVQVLSERVFGHYWPSRVASIALSLAASIVAAWLSWHLVEKHFLKLKRYFEAERGERQLRVVVASSGLGHVNRGVEAWAHDLGHALHARGVDVLLCKGGGAIDASFERIVGCWKRDSVQARRVVGCLPTPIAWRLGVASGYGVEQVTFAFNLIRLLRRQGVDILHVQDPLVASIVERCRRAGLVKTRAILAHGTEEPGSFLRRLEYVQHLAPWHGEECRAGGHWEPTWSVIPNFVDTRRFTPGPGRAIRDELGIPRDALIVLTAAAIKRKHKRVDALIDEVAVLRATEPALPVWLVVAGGEEAGTAEVVEHGRKVLGDRVKFLVRFPRERMPELYRCADVFVLASLKEMMPMAVLEALSSGVPCVVHMHPVLEWMVGDGGRAINMAQRGELARTLRELLYSTDERRVLALRARARGEAEFGQERVVDRIERYYQRILPEGERARGGVEQAALASGDGPSISVVIPAYNSARWIDEAIQSVLAQSLPPREIVVVDDGSTDDTARRLEKYRGRVVYIHQDNQGVAAARNRGIAGTTGEWVAFLDADDVWHPRKLECQVRAIADRPELAMLGTGVRDWPGEFGDVPTNVDMTTRTWAQLAVRNQFTTSSVIVRRAALEHIGGFDPQLHGPEDYDLWLRLGEQFPMGVLDAPLVGYREVAQSLGRRASSMEAGLARVLRKMDERDSWKGRWLLRRKSYSYWRYSCAYMHVSGGELRLALVRIVQSLVLYPMPLRRCEVRMSCARARLLSMIVRRIMHVAGGVPRNGTVESA